MKKIMDRTIEVNQNLTRVMLVFGNSSYKALRIFYVNFALS